MINSRVISIFIFLLLLLSLRFTYSYLTRHSYHDGEAVTLTTLLLYDIDRYSNNSQISVILPQTFPPEKAKIVLFGNSLHYGQEIKVSGRISRKLLADKRVVNTIHSPHIQVIHSIFEYPLLYLYYIREKILQNYQRTLSDTDSALLLGIVFGIKEPMSQAFTKEFQATGVTHVISASGMNVTLVAGFLIFTLGKFCKRQIAILISIMILIIYAIFAGLQASIIRATIMGITGFSAQLFGRQYNSIYILLLTAFLMLLFSPGLLFDVGFQLSFLSTVSIVLTQPLFRFHFPLSEDLMTTLGAQIGTAPILLITFGSYNIVSLLVNMLVLWTIPFLMIIGGLGAALSLCLPGVGRIVLLSAVPFLTYFKVIIGFFASTTGFLSFSKIPILLIIGYYFLAVATLSFIHVNKKRLPE